MRMDILIIIREEEEKSFPSTLLSSQQELHNKRLPRENIHIYLICHKGTFKRKWKPNGAIKPQNLNARFAEGWKVVEKWNRAKGYELRVINWAKLSKDCSFELLSQHPLVFRNKANCVLWIKCGPQAPKGPYDLLQGHGGLMTYTERQRASESPSHIYQFSNFFSLNIYYAKVSYYEVAYPETHHS